MDNTNDVHKLGARGNENGKKITELKIISLNANSLVKTQRRQDMIDMIDKRSPDIVLVSETKLNNKHKFTIENYSIIRTDCEINPRGTYLKKWLKKNEIIFRANLLRPAELSFPRGNSYLDICIIDHRIQTKYLNNNKLKVYPNDSDHRAVSITIDLNNSFNLEIEEEIKPNRYNFNKADWNKFEKSFANYTINLPDNRNLKKQEIEEYLTLIDISISRAIEAAVATTNSFDSNKCT